MDDADFLCFQYNQCSTHRISCVESLLSLPGTNGVCLVLFSDAHYQALDQLSVFSAGGNNESIGLEFQVDIDFTYFLIQDEIGDLDKELASNYKNIIVSKAKDAIKNEAIFVTFIEYFQVRKAVEERFRSAVQKRWGARPSLHCELDQFHVGRIQIPESVATKQLRKAG